MGNTYTIEAGTGNTVKYYYGTESLVVALWKLWRVNKNRKDVYWKQLKIV